MTSPGAGGGSGAQQRAAQVAAVDAATQPPPAARGSESDEDLFCAYARDGAQDAFSELVRRHSAMVRCVAQRVTGAGEDADDVLQATFLALASQARTRKPIAHLASWLHRVARNLGTHRRDAAAARRVHERQAGAYMSRRENDGADAATEAEEGGRIKAAMDQALDELPARYRQPLILHYLEGRSFDEIANALDTSTGTVASWLSRGRTLLRARLARLGHPVTTASLVLVLGDLAREHGGAGAAELLDPARLGVGSHGHAIRELAAHAQRAGPATPSLIALGLALALASLLIGAGAWAWRAQARMAAPAIAPTGARVLARGAGPAPATPAQAAPPATRFIDLDSACLGFYRYLGSDRQTTAQADAMVAHIPLMEIGSWPADQPDPWATQEAFEQATLPFRPSDWTPFLARMADGAEHLAPARAGARTILAIISDVVADDQRCFPEAVTRSGADLSVDLALWDLEDEVSARNHHYLYLLDLGILGAGAHALTLHEHVRSSANRSLRATLQFQVGDAAASAQGAPAACDRATLVEEPDHSTRGVYCETHAGSLAAALAPARCGLIGAGGLPSSDAREAPFDLARLPTPQPPADGDALRCVLVTGPITTAAVKLRVRAFHAEPGGAHLIVDDWVDPAAAPVEPHMPTMLVCFVKGPRRVTLEWHTLTRTRDGGFSDSTADAPTGLLSSIGVPEPGAGASTR